MSAIALEWISGGDTGASSISLWQHMMGLDPREAKWGVAYPHDPDDFGRCYRLLLRVPEWRSRIGEMAAYPVWNAYAPAWDRLTALWEEEIGPGIHSRWGRAPKLYAEMQQLQDGVRAPVRSGTQTPDGDG